MVKKLLAVALVVGLSAGAAQADFTSKLLTVPRAGVVNSVHDMRGYNGTRDVTVSTIDQQRVCAFCHTPHHMIQDGSLDYNPLWSHEVNQQLNFVPYMSTTLDVGLNNYYQADILVGPSRLCMSCHDGTIALDTHYNNGSATQFLQADDLFNSPNIGWGAGGGGGDLSNDHPIGFDYYAVQNPATTQDSPALAAAPGMDNYINPPETLFKGRTGLPEMSIDSRLYTPTYDPSKKIMTCASCHDVHNRKNGDTLGLGVNYLVLSPQANSALCVTCHIK